jgi:phosphoribosylaminoimidazolecarboxamide formyltransferase/IMP cyclohydrolase
MAQKIFQTTAAYDSSIASWFANKKHSALKISNLNSTLLRYGENPNQKSKYYFKSKINLIEKAKLKGSELSYNNILDLDAGLNCMTEFIEPTCVIIKHNNPCGIASGPTIHKAVIKAIEADPVSAFGGIVILNRMLNKKTAEVLNNKFFQLIAAEKFNVNAVQMLRNKKNLILINKTKLLLNKKDDIKSVMNGYLVQEKNIIKIKKNNLKCVSNIKINSKKIDDLLFALKVCKHVKSNAIVLVNNKQTIGIGAGQMSRLDSTKLALDKAGKLRRRAGYVAASDAFFPFLDNLKLLINKNCKAIAKPLGSINDAKIIKFAESKKFPLYSFKYRLFKH